MPISWSGAATLLLVISAGPLLWASWRALQVAKRSLLGCRSGQSTSNDSASCRDEQQENEAESGSRSTDREEINGVEYMLALLGYAIGIGNLWRFPYLVGKWGGGAFVVAYLCSLLLVAGPLYFVELGMGQQTRCSTLDCFRAIHPRWLGLGLAQGFMLLCCLSYFNVLIAYALYYVVASMQSPLPWSVEAAAGGAQYRPADVFALSYWQNQVLNQYDGDFGEGLGPLQWKLALALLGVWLIVFFSLAFGKHILAKVTWVTVVGPVVMLVLLLVQALRMEGAGAGVSFYVGKFDAAKLADIELWATACSQILFSLSPGFGTAITMSSFTRPGEDVFRVCAVVAVCNSAFSLVGGFAIFGILGNLAHRNNETVAEVASAGGTGLAFVAIAEGIESYGPWANVMAVLFFLTLLSLGIDSTFAWAETFVSITDDVCRKRGWQTPKRRLVACVCIVLFLLGLPYCTRLGSQLLDVVDHFVGSLFLLLSCCLEAIVFAHGYTWQRFAEGVKVARGQAIPVQCWWKLCVVFAVPLVTGLLFTQLLVTDLRRSYGEYPPALLSVGWLLLGACVALFLSTLCVSGQSSLGEPGPKKAKDDTQGIAP